MQYLMTTYLHPPNRPLMMWYVGFGLVVKIRYGFMILISFLHFSILDRGIEAAIFLPPVEK